MSRQIPSWLTVPSRRWTWWVWHGLAVAVGLVVAVSFGVTTATARGSIGPHEARFDVTTDRLVTVDLGPLGSLELDSPLPLGLGVRATVEEIPQEVTGLDPADTLTALQGDIDQYIGFFAGIGTAVRTVAVRLVVDAVWRSVWAFVVLVALWWAARLALGGTRRAELVDALRPRTRAVSIVTVGVLVMAGGFSGSARSTGTGDELAPVSPVFDGTPLAGARITGRLGGLINTYSGALVDAVQANDTFYDGVSDTLAASWPDAVRGVQPTPTVGPGAAVWGTPASATPVSRPPVTVVMMTDLHCNVGMARVVSELVDLTDAAVVVDGGDTTLNGTTVEDQCVQTFAGAIPPGVKLVAVPGNHDSRVTSAAYEDAGAIMLDGSEVTVAGIRFFGDADPDQTLFGDSSSTRDETEQEAAARIGEDVCDLGDVDVLLIHNPRIATPALRDGCVAASLSGHLHSRTDPVQVGGGIRYIGASSGGASLGSTTLGPLHHTAELTVLTWDPTTRLFVSWRVVQVFPDGSVTVGDLQPWPQISLDEPAPAPEPTGGD
jgi:predicted phosphodiesterase